MRRLPDDVFATLQAVCAAYPYAAVQSAADLGAVLNRVAWAHRGEGWGVSRKDFGTCVPSPVGLIAEDVLHHQPTNLHWDVLAGAGVGQPLRPIQTDAIGPMTDPRRPWVAPADPGGDAPVVTPPVDVHACRFAACDFGPLTALVTQHHAALVQQVADLSAQVAALSADMHALFAAQNVEHLDDLKQRIDALAQAGGGGTACRFPRWR
jgi:hypothetical protein